MQPRRLCRRAAPGSPRATGGFTVVELLVVVSIILALMALIGAAVAAATANGKEAATRATIGKLDTILQAQLARYGSRYVDTSSPGDMTKAVYRAWKIRREMITGDMVDRWSDVDLMVADNPTGINPTNDDENVTFTSAPQRSYIATRQNGGTPSSTYAGAECLFMIITQGGFADCLDCNALKNVRRGDKDNDGYFEFWDEWENPIGYILWPAGVKIPVNGEAKYFSGDRTPEPAFSGSPSPTLGLRPLIYSAGPDGEYGFERNGEAATLNLGSDPPGRDCGNPAADPISKAGQPIAGKEKNVLDNLTNLDEKASL